VGLDLSRFEHCLTSGIHRAAVQKDVEDGIRLGVTGTPAFFINGRLLLGALPLESFVRVIDEELVRTRAAEPNGEDRP
jgi:protein-disulfide isomerase